MNTNDDDILSKIAGNIIISENPGKMLKNWRERLRIKQILLAEGMKVSPSVLSDYESGRRKSPGAVFIKKYLESLINIDKEKRKNLEKLFTEKSNNAILSMKEFQNSPSASEILDLVDGELLTGEEFISNNIYGFTLVDSIKAIYFLSGIDFYKIFGATTERVLIFTKVGMGRSPLVAIRVSQLKPRMVILHGPKEVDELAIDLAKREKIILAISRIPKEEDFEEILTKIWGEKELSLINNLINSVNNISEYIILLFLIFVFIYFSYKKNILDKTGITASIIIGIMIFIGGGWKFIAIISSFYILGIATTNFRKSKKRINSITKEKSTTRSYTNVIANGGIASILAFASIMVESELLAIAFTGAILTATADTIATEIGLLSKSTPFFLLKPSKKCMKGESGGVTILGLTSSFT